MSYKEEFATVDLIRASCAETRGVDAFALSLTKAERQIRKLVTHLVFQFPCFNASDVPSLRNTLANNRKVYFKGLINGFNSIYPKTIETMVGNKYQQLLGRIKEAIEHRNKIFHGQLTNQNLSREDLLAYVDDISDWCRTLAEAAYNEIGYDGFARNSFQKSSRNNISDTFQITFHSVQDYEAFIKQNMQRPKPTQPDRE
jgi:hypothetical protein